METSEDDSNDEPNEEDKAFINDEDEESDGNDPNRRNNSVQVLARTAARCKLQNKQSTTNTSPTRQQPLSPIPAVGVRKYQQIYAADSDAGDDECEDLTTAAPKFNTRKFKIADNVFARNRHIITQDFAYDAWVITRVPPAWDRNGKTFNFNLSLKSLPMLKIAINKQCPD